MKTIGFPISIKNNEKRRALLPTDIKKIKHRNQLYFEEGYGHSLGISDNKYKEVGVNISNRENILSKDIICDPKIGDANYLENLENQTIFGWVHAVQNTEITQKIIDNNLKTYAWEDMYEKSEHVFYRNNEIAGEAAIMHAFINFGLTPYNLEVAVIGNGNVARGAIKVLNRLGSKVKVYTRRTEKLLRKELSNYDVIVNAVLWDTSRKDHLIYEKDLIKMKSNSLIIDISCDENGGLETSVPTTIDSPTYITNDVTHYVVDNTPSILYRTATSAISNALWRYIDDMLEEKEDITLRNALIIENGNVIDQRINQFQNR